jgi:hypothetical protein
MKKAASFALVLTATFLMQLHAQNNANPVKIKFQNDYKDVYHLALIIYTPDGKNITRVSNLQPNTTKVYEWPAGSEIYIADWEQEAYAMKGNDIRSKGLAPFIIVTSNDNGKIILLSKILAQKTDKESSTTKKPDPKEALGSWQIDLRPSPESEPYYKEFKFTKIEGKNFEGEFYGYPFTGGLLNTDWDKIYFAFTTADQSGTYFHSGYIEDGKVFGVSLSEGRKFVLPWRGVRK